MSKITIVIETNNSAFSDGNMTEEINRILQGIIDINHTFNHRLVDINGNKVGFLEIEEDDNEEWVEDLVECPICYDNTGNCVHRDN